MSDERAARAVFLDKDGTLIEDVPYNVDPARIRLTPGAGEALARLHTEGFRIAVVSNQSGVAFGHFSESALRDVRERIRELLEEVGVPLAGFFYCPHHPNGSVHQYTRPCSCRKPAPGLLYTAAQLLGVDLQASWVIGDILDDVEAGMRAGCHTVLLNNGGETEWRMGPHRMPEYIVTSLEESAEAVLRHGTDATYDDTSSGPSHQSPSRPR